MGKCIPMQKPSSPLYSPAWVKGGASPSTSWFPTSKTKGGCLQLQVCAGCCSHKPRHLVMDTFRVQNGWAWEFTASCHIKASSHSSVWDGSCYPLTFFLLRPQRLTNLLPSYYLFVASNQGFFPSLTFWKIHTGLESSEFKPPYHRKSKSKVPRLSYPSYTMWKLAFACNFQWPDWET